MKAKFKKLMKNQKGMTLIELLAVIVIIAIIALIAIPAIGNIINKSHDKAILSDASQVISSAKIAIADGSCETDDTDKTITCNKAELDDKVDGITLDKDDKVVKTQDTNGKSVYTITFKKFASFKTNNFKKTETNTDGIDSDNTITDAKLAKLMGNK
ncbi:prepilin-type N-terminal cleavage/methylation domain-containing protein [Rummeliibacillus sp. SL167]|uniref:prepilin-type N-terminal cleavage/methylation domain-containing protein n=1 Tax=Rummeliibacillus sp. SL167 TaxID=2579792 RepID=UPI0011B372C7|nr:prepilin-type N-terminal cleavage/methylation domain-containing protein [Rummeliibacillus sp. SL167]